MVVRTFKIKRFNPAKDEKPYWQEYNVDVAEHDTVLLALLKILEDHDPSLGVRYACRAGVCGSDAMLINGKYALGCETLVANIKGTIVLEPLTYYPVIKDLVVDMDAFFEKLKAIRPYLILDESKTFKDEDGEIRVHQSPEERDRIDPFPNCILCGACYASCPTVWTDKNYLGPAALAKQWRFVADTRDAITEERLKIVESESGVYRCHTAFECTEACPKSIPCTVGIQNLKKTIAKRKIKSLLKLGR